MASFTDRVPTFNPYVQQMPVEAMVAVGTEKQRRYDEGVQKIQTQIDNIAGLDITKDLHKSYLHSKLNELGTKLKLVGASDFSNFQLTNSVSGMATRIAKDPVIQNAVYSTQVIRKGQQEMDAARKAGKSSVQNEEWWNKNVNDWNNDGSLTTKFNDSFVEYTDIDKKLREVAEKVHEIDNSIDIPFKRDNAGNTLYYIKDPKTGALTASTDPRSGGTVQIDEAMLRIKTKGKPAEKLLNNFTSALNENDQRQLRIDSWYHYRGATKDTFKADIVSNYNSSKKMANDEIVNLTLEMQTNTKLTAPEKADMQAKITALNKKITSGALEEDLKKQLEMVDTTDVENYKYRVYTQKTLTKLAQDMAYQSYQQEFLTNPYFQADMAKRDLQFKYENLYAENKRWMEDHLQRDERLAWDKTKAQMEARAKAGTPPVVVPTRLSTDVDTPSIDKLNAEIVDIRKGIDQLNAEYADMPAVKNLPSVEAKKAYLDGLASSFAKDPSFITTQPIEVKEYLRKRRGYEVMADQRTALAKAALEKSSGFDGDIDAVMRTVPGISVGGYNYSAKELYEFTRDANIYITSQSSGSSSAWGPASVSTLNERELLSKYRGTNKEALAVAFIKNYNNQPLSLAERALIDRSKQVYTQFRPAINQIVEKKLKFQSEFLAERMPERQGQKGTLTSKADMEMVEQVLGNKTDEYMRGGVDSERLKEYNPATVAAWRKNPKMDVTYTIEKNYNGTAKLIISNGSDRQIIPFTANEFRSYFPTYSKNNPINEIKYDILASPNKSTNPEGVVDGSSAVRAGLSGYDIPQLKGTPAASIVRMDVVGSRFNDGGVNDRYQVILYVHDGNMWQMQPVNDEYVDDAGLQEVINNIGTATIKDVLRKSKTK